MKEKIKAFIDYLYLRQRGVETKLGYVKLQGFPIIKKTPGSVIKIDAKVTLVSNSRFNVAGVNHPVIIATLTKEACIEIGYGSGMSGGSIVAAKKIKIGKHCGLGSNVCVFDTDFHAINPQKRLNQTDIYQAKIAPVNIGDHVWLGADSMVLKGVSIGNNAVIGAMSLVNKNISNDEIWAGNPAKLIKMII